MDDEKVTCGSGGGSVGLPGGSDLDGDHMKSYMGTYGISANAVEIVSRPQEPPTSPDPNVISIFAPGFGTNGLVNIRGSQGVRVTAGPPPIPPASSESTSGLEVEVSEEQNITIKCGPIPDVNPMIGMTADSILVDGGVGTVTIQSFEEIVLQVAGGVASIKLTPTGIILQGPIIQIN